MNSTSTQVLSQFPWKQWWILDPGKVYLNHGAFGACPRPVLDRQVELRERLENNPTAFIVRELEGLLDEARGSLADFLGVHPLDLALVPNATTGVNTVLQSLSFAPGDELLTTNQEYNACRNALDAIAHRTKAKVVVASIPFPFDDSEIVVNAILEKVSEKTRLVLVDHITSMTSVIFPIATLARELSDRNIDLLVDGAHAPEQIPLNIRELGVAYYTANCHKWLCAPKGSGFLYVRSDKQERIRPLTISNGANSTRSDRSRFHLEFDWTGTDDPTPYLCIPEAINFIDTQVPGGWPALMEYNHQTIVTARRVLCKALGIAIGTPDTLMGSMVSLPLPDGCASTLYGQLSEQKDVEVAIMPFPNPPNRLLRICAQIYNTQADYQRLAIALAELL